MESYEIELKAILSDKKFDELKKSLPKSMKLIKETSIHTRKFKKDSSDIRLRHDNKEFEIVFKKGPATKLSRKETTIKVNSIEELNSFADILKSLGIKEDPSWVTYRLDFNYQFKGFEYQVSLQDTANFAKILEVEFFGDKSQEKLHEQNIIEIIKSLGCEPIDNKEFTENIKKYIKENENK